MGFLDGLSAALTTGTGMAAANQEGQIAAQQRATQGYMSLMNLLREQQLAKSEIGYRKQVGDMDATRAEMMRSGKYTWHTDINGNMWATPTVPAAGHQPGEMIQGYGPGGGATQGDGSTGQPFSVNDSQFQAGLNNMLHGGTGSIPQSQQGTSSFAQGGAPQQQQPKFYPNHQPRPVATTGANGQPTWSTPGVGGGTSTVMNGADGKPATRGVTSRGGATGDMTDTRLRGTLVSRLNDLNRQITAAKWAADPLNQVGTDVAHLKQVAAGLPALEEEYKTVSAQLKQVSDRQRRAGGYGDTAAPTKAAPAAQAAPSKNPALDASLDFNKNPLAGSLPPLSQGDRDMAKQSPAFAAHLRSLGYNP
jgi:hypothetical protein